MGCGSSKNEPDKPEEKKEKPVTSEKDKADPKPKSDPAPSDQKKDEGDEGKDNDNEIGKDKDSDSGYGGKEPTDVKSSQSHRTEEDLLSFAEDNDKVDDDKAKNWDEDFTKSPTPTQSPRNEEDPSADNDTDNEAATKIQAQFRGYRTRKELQKKRGDHPYGPPRDDDDDGLSVIASRLNTPVNPNERIPVRRRRRGDTIVRKEAPTTKSAPASPLKKKKGTKAKASKKQPDTKATVTKPSPPKPARTISPVKASPIKQPRSKTNSFNSLNSERQKKTDTPDSKVSEPIIGQARSRRRNQKRVETYKKAPTPVKSPVMSLVKSDRLPSVSSMESFYSSPPETQQQRKTRNRRHSDEYRRRRHSSSELSDDRHHRSRHRRHHRKNRSESPHRHRRSRHRHRAHSDDSELDIRRSRHRHHNDNKRSRSLSPDGKLRDDNDKSKRNHSGAGDEDEQAAVKIQAAFRGYRTRRDLDDKRKNGKRGPPRRRDPPQKSNGATSLPANWKKSLPKNSKGFRVAGGKSRRGDPPPPVWTNKAQGGSKRQAWQNDLGFLNDE